ncbi:MAG: 7-cyano-7-deazaguanine synthase QueC [Pseudomonadota bacterium]
MALQDKKAIVLLSGGLDSTTCLALAKKERYECYALSFRYGQRHVVELLAASQIAKAFGVREHLVMEIDLRRIGGSALTDDIPVPVNRIVENAPEKIPVTYVPARNTIFLSFALAWAEVLDCRDIFIGVNALDYSGYPDCRPTFIEAFEDLATKGTRIGTERGGRINIHAPLIQMTKAEIIRVGISLGVDYGMTQSCYAPKENGKACGQCDSCLLRQKGFAKAGVQDPLERA